MKNDGSHLLNKQSLNSQMLDIIKLCEDLNIKEVLPKIFKKGDKLYSLFIRLLKVINESDILYRERITILEVALNTSFTEQTLNKFVYELENLVKKVEEENCQVNNEVFSLVLSNLKIALYNYSQKSIWVGNESDIDVIEVMLGFLYASDYQTLSNDFEKAKDIVATMTTVAHRSLMLLRYKELMDLILVATDDYSKQQELLDLLNIQITNKENHYANSKIIIQLCEKYNDFDSVKSLISYMDKISLLDCANNEYLIKNLIKRFEELEIPNEKKLELLLFVVDTIASILEKGTWISEKSTLISNRSLDEINKIISSRFFDIDNQDIENSLNSCKNKLTTVFAAIMQIKDYKIRSIIMGAVKGYEKTENIQGETQVCNLITEFLQNYENYDALCFGFSSGPQGSKEANEEYYRCIGLLFGITSSENSFPELIDLLHKQIRLITDERIPKEETSHYYEILTLKFELVQSLINLELDKRKILEKANIIISDNRDLSTIKSVKGLVKSLEERNEMPLTLSLFEKIYSINDPHAEMDGLISYAIQVLKDNGDIDYQNFDIILGNLITTICSKEKRERLASLIYKKKKLSIKKLAIAELRKYQLSLLTGEEYESYYEQIKKNIIAERLLEFTNDIDFSNPDHLREVKTLLEMGRAEKVEVINEDNLNQVTLSLNFTSNQ